MWDVTGPIDPRDLRIYERVIRSLKDAYSLAYGEELITGGTSVVGRLQGCIHQLSERLKTSREHQELAAILDVPPGGSIIDLVQKLLEAAADRSTITEADQLTPEQFKEAIYAEAQQRGRTNELVDVPLAEFLKSCIKRAFKTNELKGRLNVGPNRHFPRLFQWLKEVDVETNWSDGHGLRIGNLNGRGPVPARPIDPKKLRVRINIDYL